MTDLPCPRNNLTVTVTGLGTVTVFHCLSAGQTVGLSVATGSAFLSLVSVTIVFALILRNFWRKALFPPTPDAKQCLIQVPADVFMLSLFIADLVQAVGGAMCVKWVHEEIVYRGQFCTAQGAIYQLGETTVALVTLIIAVHTFSSVWWGRGVKSCLTAAIIVGIAWLFVSLYVGIGIGVNNAQGYYITPTPYWCWIGPEHYLKEKITGEYMWFWLTLGLSLTFYVPLFFWSLGNITIDQHKWWKFSVHRSRDSHDDDNDDRRRHAVKLIIYPVIYSILIIPLSIVRFIEFHQQDKHQDHVPTAWVFFSYSVYLLSGILNVLLFILTRRGLLLFGNIHGSTLSDRCLSCGNPSGVYNGMSMGTLGRLPSLDEASLQLPREGEEK